MERFTKYASELMSVEVKISDLRKEFKIKVIGSADPVNAAENVIIDYLISDSIPSTVFDFNTKEDAAGHRNQCYDFWDYPSNNLVILKGTAVETYIEDEEGNWIQGDGWDFPTLTKGDYEKLLKILNLDDEEV